MKTNLIRKLVSVGIFRENTELDAYYAGTDLGGAPLSRSRGTFFVKGAKIIKDKVVFATISTTDGRPRDILAENVVKVDGMCLDTLAPIYGLVDNGEAIPMGKRRGRRP